MAHLDTLIAMIPDEKLRNEIQNQVSRLTAKASFGLVFEEHRPETVQLPGFEVTRGGKVVFKDGSIPGIWTVLRMVEGVATIVRTGDTAERQTAGVGELVVIREFGDPIYPGLQSVGSVTRGGDKPFHCVINAENFHAAEMLLYPYSGKVDAIYLDPPYNTGAKDWKYNNDYVDGADFYRHSKWLSFMDKRLRLAQKLLNPTGSVLIVTIDEKEVLRLGLLLEQVFKGASIQMVSSVINPTGVNRDSEFRRTDEYIFFVRIGSARVTPTVDSSVDKALEATSEPYWRNLRRSGSGSLRGDRPNSFYPLHVDLEYTKISSVGAPYFGDVADYKAPTGTVAVWPMQPNGREGRWQLGAESAAEAIKEGFVRLRGSLAKPVISYLASGEQIKVKEGQFKETGREPSGARVLQGTLMSLDQQVQVPGTAWAYPAHSSRHHGAALLAKLLPLRSFPYPKSLYAVEDALRFFIKEKRDALVLDFFGGSGTTAHAVMRLNKQDGGQRRSIVVTNNAVSDEEDRQLREADFEPGDAGYEAQGIFEYITKPRLEAAVTGNTPEGQPIAGDYKFVDEFPMSEGFEENVEFFKLTYEDNQLVRLGRKFEAIAPILWMRAGAEGERIDVLPADGWALPKKGFYGVLTDVDQWEPFVDAVNARDNVRCVFIVTDSQAEFEAINVQIDQGIDSVRLYSDYLQSFEINTRQG